MNSYYVSHRSVSKRELDVEKIDRYHILFKFLKYVLLNLISYKMLELLNYLFKWIIEEFSHNKK